MTLVSFNIWCLPGIISSKAKTNVGAIKKVANNKNAYKYLEESISQFPNQKILLDKMNNAGFEKTSYINLFDGIVSIHIGFKI